MPVRKKRPGNGSTDRAILDFVLDQITDIRQTADRRFMFLVALQFGTIGAVAGAKFF